MVLPVNITVKQNKAGANKENKMADEVKVLSASEQKKEDWMNSKWRPMMGWMYMLVCTMDFVVFPILWSLLQSISHGAVNVQWQPITLQGAGLFHIAMGAVLGIAAFGRTQEKLGGANNGGIQTPTMMAGSSTGFQAPQPSYSQYTPPSYDSQVVSVSVGYGGKAAPPQAPQPLL